MNQIFELLPKVMADIGEVPKLQRNAQQGWSFRGVDDAMNHGNKALTRHGVSVSVTVHDLKRESWDRETAKGAQRVSQVTLLMKVTFFAPDGTHIENILAGEGMDFGDKATNKAMAAAFKYGLFYGLVMPVDRKSIDDGDAESLEYTHPEPAEAEPERQQPKAKPAPRAQNETQEQANRAFASSEQPADTLSPALKAQTAVQNAPDELSLDKLQMRIRTCGQFSGKVLEDLEAEVVRRRSLLVKTQNDLFDGSTTAPKASHEPTDQSVFQELSELLAYKLERADTEDAIERARSRVKEMSTSIKATELLRQGFQAMVDGKCDIHKKNLMSHA